MRSSRLLAPNKRHATNGQYLGKSEIRAHGIGIHFISSSRQNKVVLTAALDGTVALWDTSDISALLQSSEANTNGGDEESSRTQQSGVFPLTLLKSMKFSKDNAPSVNEIDGVNEAPALDSKSEYLMYASQN
jgi:hypothetical protein